MPRRYGRMALLSSGHSPRARDVTHGHVAGRGVRAFDFRCEAGHATRRVTRHYSVLVAEGVEAPRVLMWHVEDLALAPLAAREGRTVAAPWRCVGEPSAAEQLAHAAGALGERPVSMEVRDGKLLLCAPTSGADREDAIGPDDLEMLLNRLDAERVSRHASDVEITPPAR
ncbi:MAG: hypothetical protein KGY99_09305 [Phycisphaerae bacterium]|nr:hypothetical protein [Phycisphaerae bacterium]